VGTIADEWIRRHEETRHPPGVLAQWINSYPYQIKVVVGSAGEADEALSTLKRDLPGLPNGNIFLMPEGIDPETLARRSTWLIDFCKNSGYRYCHRLHIQLFGNTKGT
jgi:7-carboxy-7-deazaguanine synthase